MYVIHRYSQYLTSEILAIFMHIYYSNNIIYVKHIAPPRYQCLLVLVNGREFWCIVCYIGGIMHHITISTTGIFNVI